MDDRIEDLEREVSYWKRVAIYLADCHAATAEGVMDRKASSMSERRRQASICQTAADALDGKFDRRDRPVLNVRTRCLKAINRQP